MALLAASLFVVRYQFAQALAENLNQQVETINSTVGVMLLPTLVMDGVDVEAELAKLRSVLRVAVTRQDDIAQVEVFDDEGRPLIRYPDKPPANLPMASRLAPIKITDRGKTYGYVRVLFDMSDYETLQRHVFGRILLMGLLFAVFGFAASIYLARTITRPVEHLRDTARSFGKEIYHARARIESRDEIGELAVTFNEMAGRIEKNVNRIRMLQDWSREVAGNLEIEKVLEISVEAFRAVGGIAKMSIMLYNEGSECLEIKRGAGLDPGAESFMKLKPGEGAAGKAFTTGRPVYIDNIGASEEYRVFTTAQPRSGRLLAIPLVASGRCLGVVNLHEKTDGTGFDDSDQSLLTTLAEIVAVAVDNANLYDMAITDGLTKLYIQRYFQKRLEDEIKLVNRTGLPLSLLMADIDHFKQVNDTYGHLAGDAVLVALARVMHRVFREVDICCRYGGEEFAVIMPNTDQRGALIAAERFRSAIEEFKFTTSAGDLAMTVSCGVTTFRPGVSKVELIHEADTALYDSKTGGRNRSTHFLARKAS